MVQQPAVDLNTSKVQMRQDPADGCTQHKLEDATCDACRANAHTQTAAGNHRDGPMLSKHTQALASGVEQPSQRAWAAANDFPDDSPRECEEQK